MRAADLIRAVYGRSPLLFGYCDRCSAEAALQPREDGSALCIVCVWQADVLDRLFVAQT